MTPLETYLRELRDIRSTGAAVKETSYYPALGNLFNEVGKTLKPKVRCILTLANRGAGLPDGGLFTPDQFQKPSDSEPLPGQIPARGVIEIKSTGDDAWVTADSEQVTRYWRKYRQVLVTNYRDFVLVGQDAEGKAVKLESFRLAENEKAFWAAASAPRALAKNIGDRFIEYIQRVMRHAVPIAAPEDVAWFLASYARDARARIEGVDLPALATVRAALEEALGLKFQGEKGEHFFRSSLVQTLFYGVFSAWVLWAKQHPQTAANLFIQNGNGGVKPPLRFDWMSTARYLRVPMIRKLFYLVADPQELEALNLTEVLDWTAMVLNRVDRRSFFEKFQESHAVQYFYEPFLEAFDPDLRKELGVWYTPPEIVKYMVERVDTVLRQELGVPLGLADKNVYVLDPCCGTGSYLVEVLDRIHRTIKERGEDGLTASDLKDAAQHRVFGFEILPAPFVVSHLQLGLLLQNLGAPLDDVGARGARPPEGERRSPLPGPERAGVYLTNALTGWEPPKGPKKKLLFAELEEERDAAEHVKRDVPILVILGNPPYNAFAGVSPEEEQGLVEPYKRGLKDWGITKNYLDDLYVRFFRLAERRIAEKTGRGIVSFISNHSWVDDPTYVVLRQHLLTSFDHFWIENMHGNRKISEYAPDGRTSETVFATPGFSVGIQQGVVVSLWAKTGRQTKDGPRVFFRDDLSSARAVQRRSDLLESLNDKNFDAHYRQAKPSAANRFSFRPGDVARGYETWAGLNDLASADPMLGLNDNRMQATHDISKLGISQRMKAYYDPAVPYEEIAALHVGLATDAASFNARETRARLLAQSAFKEENLRRFWFKPFDLRWAYAERVGNLWNRIRPELLHQNWPGNHFLLARRHAPKAPDGATFFYTEYIADQHVLHTDAYFIPVRLSPLPSRGKADRQRNLPHSNPETLRTTANLSLPAREYLKTLGFPDADADVEVAGLIWLHSLTIGYSPAYLAQNADGIRQDWPRIPLPDSKDLLLASAALGGQIASLLDTETPFIVGPGLAPAWPTQGPTNRPTQASALQNIAVPTRVGGGQLDDTKDFAVTAGWGHSGKGGITMPGKGRIVERDFTPSERGTAVSAVEPHGQDAHATLGDRTCDVYLNDVAYWKNVPIRVWEYTIGGYQVMKKWLSYREEKLLGRALTKDEVRYVQEMARRIAAILLLEPALDANYASAKAHAYVWPA